MTSPTIRNPALLAEVDKFLAETGMGEKYFGKAATGNSEVVPRLRNGGRVWPETEAKIRSFILLRRQLANNGHNAILARGRKGGAANRQGAAQ